MFSVAALAEVKLEGGVARATSNYTAPYTADKAFIPGHANCWYNSDGEGKNFPQVIWYEFPEAKRFVPGRVSFRGRQRGCEDCFQSETPTMWQFIGSNDETCDRFSRWTVLCQDLSDRGYPNNKRVKYCNVDDKITSEFRCLGITILNNLNISGEASLKDVRMWKKTYQ